MDRVPTLKQMQYFAALAEAGHYRKAAERIGISQPSLSQQILNFEGVLRLTLVERGRAGAVLTPRGSRRLARMQPYSVGRRPIGRHVGTDQRRNGGHDPAGGLSGFGAVFSA